MNKLGMSLMFVLAVVGCSKSKDAGTGSAGGSATAGSAMAGSAGSAMAGSAMAGSAMAGSGSGSDMGSAMAGSAAGSGSAVAMAGSGAGSGSATWDFDKLKHEEQMDFMKKHVVPTMKPLFQKFDAKHYANFGCKTCHGKDPKASKYKMPTPELPKLDFAALKAGKQKPQVAKFMGDVVEPEMAKLLQKPVYNPEKPDPSQFGCLGCHQQKK
ncbi:MAG TPA: hypothetical protein VFQ65_00640 [Kofleriaceae bacterium]|nr:hypothetical protein [Kofleriaceae bacterium]